MQQPTSYLTGTILSTLLALSCPADAQTTPSETTVAEQASPSQPAVDEQADSADEIVVTGRAGAGERSKLETSYAITTLSNDYLRTRAPSSVTEALKSVPGFWVEASGGEGSGNIRARGIPVDGFGSVNLLEDGLPVQHDPSLGYLNADQAFRIDDTVDRVEVVRGGPSSIFTPNAPGGVINFIIKRAGDTPSGSARVLYGPTANLLRADAWFGAPLGDWRLGVGGFYRDEDGVRDPGYTGNRGGQVRVDLGREFDRGRIDFSYKRLDDRAIFYTGIPLARDTDGDITGVPGFDANYDTTASRATAYLTLRSANGPLRFDNTEGTRIRLDQYSAMADYEIADGWTLSNKARYRESETVRNGVYPAALSTAEAYIVARRPSLLAAFPGATSVLLRYVDTGEAFDIAGQNGNGLVLENSARPVSVDEKEFLDDLRLVHRFDLFGQSHDVAIGAYYAHISETFGRYSATTVQNVSGDSRLLDLVALDGTGQVIGAQTQNGVSRFGSEFANGTGKSDTFALYASDEWQLTPTLRIDGGVRYERIETDGEQEGSTSVDLGDAATLADNNVLTGNGVLTGFDRNFDQFGFTIGADWQFASVAGAFARYTRAFRLPSVGSFITSATARPVTQKIDLYEAGLKLSTGMVSFYATAFNTDYSSYAISNFAFNPGSGGYDQRTEYADTRTYGVELEGVIRPIEWFDFSANGTVQNPEFRNLRFTEFVGGAPVDRDYSGNTLLRVPEVSFRLTPAVTLLGDRLRAQVDVEHYTKRYADAANTSVLPAYTVLNASARFALTPRLNLYAYGDNLTNEVGLTEGNPRSGELSSGQASSQLFIGRPILGRSFRIAAAYAF